MKNFESYESNRWIWRVNIALQIVLVVALVALVNFIGLTVWARFDLTRNRTYSLAAETQAYIRKLTEPVKVIVTIAPDDDDPQVSQILRDVRGVLREFEYAARGNPAAARIETEYLNVFEKRQRAEALGVADRPNLVVFQTRSGKHKPVEVRELYELLDDRRRRFKGERVFALALHDVSTRQLPVLYFLTGHGEMSPNAVAPDRGVSKLEDELVARAYRTEELDLSKTREVPREADDSMVLILSPRTPLLRSEQEMLRDYLTTRAGRVLLTLDPGANHGLDDLLYQWGVLADDVLVEERDSGSRLLTGELLVRSMAAEHPITRALGLAGLKFVFGSARSVRPDPGRPFDDSLVVTGLFRTSDTSWGESDYRRAPFTFDDRDLRGPIVLATAAERRVADTNLRGGRLLVFGSGDFLANNRLDKLGNLALTLEAVAWSLALDRGTNIAARPVEMLKLTFSEQQLAVTSVVLILGPSLVVMSFGLLVYLSRRR